MILFGGASIIVFAKMQLCGWKGSLVSGLRSEYGMYCTLLRNLFEKRGLRD